MRSCCVQGSPLGVRYPRPDHQLGHAFDDLKDPGRIEAGLSAHALDRSPGVAGIRKSREYTPRLFHQLPPSVASANVAVVKSVEVIEDIRHIGFRV